MKFPKTAKKVGDNVLSSKEVTFNELNLLLDVFVITLMFYCCKKKQIKIDFQLIYELDSTFNIAA